MCNSHAYKDVWSPIIREESFESLRENENKIPSLQWQFIVMAFVINRWQDMYHIISKCFSSFYCYNSVLLCEVIGEQTHSGQLRLHTTRESEKTKTIEKNEKPVPRFKFSTTFLPLSVEWKEFLRSKLIWCKTNLSPD